MFLSAKEVGANDYQINIWSAIFAPKDTPQPVVDKLNDALNKTLNDPAVAKRLLELGGTVPAKADRGPAHLASQLKAIYASKSDPEGSGGEDQLMLTRSDSESAVRERARAIAKAGDIEQALAKGLPKLIECSLSEALVLGLLKQGVRKYFAIFGHGSTDLGNVLRIYEAEGATRTINCRNEVEMAHAATALRNTAKSLRW